MEGNRRYQNAIYGLEKLESIVDTLIVIPNDKLLDLAPDLPLHTAFKVSDEIFECGGIEEALDAGVLEEIEDKG